MAVFFILIIGAWGLIQTPMVQNYVADSLTSWISANTNHELTINRIRISWFDQVALREVMLKDTVAREMVQAQSLTINYDLFQLLGASELAIDDIELETAKVHLIKANDSASFNLINFINRLSELSSPTEDTTKAAPILIDRIQLEDVRFKLDNEDAPLDPSGFDNNHINFQLSSIEMLELGVFPDSIGMFIQNFKGKDMGSQLTIDQFDARLQYGPKNLILDELLIRTPHSAFGDSVAFNYDQPSALASFMDSISFHVRLADVIIASEDLQTFVDDLPVFQPLVLSGNIFGQVKNLEVKDLKLTYGTSELYLNMSAQGLPDVESTLVAARIDRSKLYLEDFKLFTENFPRQVVGLKWLALDMRIEGSMKDFETKLAFITPEGEGVMDLNMQIPDDFENASYNSQLQVSDFNVGLLLGDTATFQNLDLKGKVIGKGLTPEKVSLITDFVARDVGLKQYVYDSIVFRGFVALQKYSGNFSIVDPNCRMKGKANIDLKAAPQKISANLFIDSIKTRSLNLTEQDFFLKSIINWKQVALDPDLMLANLKMLNTEFRMDSTQRVKWQMAEVDIAGDSTERTLRVTMPGVDASLNGQYTFSNLGNLIQTEVAELSRYFTLIDTVINHDIDPLKASFKMKLGNVEQYTSFLDTSLHIAPGTEMELLLEQKPEADVIINGGITSSLIAIGGNKFQGNQVDVYASVDDDTNDILASVNVTSTKQYVGDMDPFDHFSTEAVWLNDRIDLDINLHQEASATDSNIRAELLLASDSLIFDFKPSRIKTLGQEWRVDEENMIKLDSNGVWLDHVQFFSGDRLIGISGNYSDLLKSRLDVTVKNIDLYEFQEYGGLEVEGIVNADFSLTQIPGEPFAFDGEFTMDEFLYENFLIGDIQGSASWDRDRQSIKMGLTLDRENFRTIYMRGNYFPNEVEKQLSFILAFDQADLKMFQPFLKGTLNDMQGLVTGYLNVGGRLDAPELSGAMRVKDAGFTVVYLGAYYNYSGTLNVSKDALSFRNFELVDQDGHKASVSGEVKHENFKKIQTGLTIDAKKFQFLNTTRADNALYYGRAVATGRIEVSGPLNDLVVEVDATTEKGTRLYIPITTGEALQNTDFVTFIDLTDSVRTEKREREVGESLGLTLDFDLQITTDAYTELIFNIKTGDIIRGRGDGNLKLTLDKNGNFELFGDLVLAEGAYNFTVPNFMSKEFIVKRGGTIRWFGSPYNGILDMEATYVQRASLDPILNPDFDPSEATGASQRYPVVVGLNLDGEMLSPEISFDIYLDESVGTVTPEISSALSSLRANEQELKRQVVSLMFFKRFMPLNQGFVGGNSSSGVLGSVSEFLTSQASYLVSQLDENLELEIDLANMDQEGYNTFRLRLAYTFMEGRLKVTKGGNFASNSTGTQDQNSLESNIIGDWAVEYMLTEDGRLRAKMFSQTNENRNLPNRNNTNIETGLSLRYTRSFYSFVELLGKARDKAIRRKEEEEESEDKSSGTR